MKVHLQVVQGPDTGLSFSFEVRDRFLIGRSPDVQFQIKNDPYFSRHHAMLEINPPNVVLEDLGSSNGTRVNDVAITAPTTLKHGDTVSGGGTRLQFSVEAALTAATEVPASAGPAPTDLGPLVAIRCGLCGARSNEPPRGRHEKMAFFCQGCQENLVSQPRLLPGYQLIRKLGQGAMGAVYLATRPDVGERAIKMILPKAAMSETLRRMFIREAVSQFKVTHPRVVQVYEFEDTARGIFCMSMEYVDGIGSDKLLANAPNGVAPPMAATIVAQALEGLGHAHALGLVHRDIKDENLLVSRDAEGNVSVKLADFGLAKSYESSGATHAITGTGMMGGTPPYMPPEQILHYRDVKPASDIYSMGAALYHLLTNRFAYGFSDGGNWIRTILEEEIVPVRHHNPNISSALAAVVETAMRKDPNNRYATAEQMRAALLAAVA